LSCILPGTVLEYSPEKGEDAFNAISSVLEATGGISLFQVCKITGLNQPTVQNWVKRGWVSKPCGKKYTETQMSRILLINMLKKSMSLDDIVRIMTYINGSVEDKSDDIIADRILYNYICKMIYLINYEKKSLSEVEATMRSLTNNFTGYLKEDADKVKAVLNIIIMAYTSAQLRIAFEKNIEQLNIKI